MARNQMRPVEILTLAWCALATVVVILALKFAYQHPAEFRRCGGPCHLVEAQPCPCLNHTSPAMLDKP
jgi:hypothetical protein